MIDMELQYQIQIENQIMNQKNFNSHIALDMERRILFCSAGTLWKGHGHEAVDIDMSLEEGQMLQNLKQILLHFLKEFSFPGELTGEGYQSFDIGKCY